MRTLVGAFQKYCSREGKFDVDRIYIPLCASAHWGMFVISRTKMKEHSPDDIYLEVGWGLFVGSLLSASTKQAIRSSIGILSYGHYISS